MKRLAFILAAVTVLVALIPGCARRTVVVTDQGVAGSAAAGTWQFLGKRTVHGRGDRDEIAVTGSEGRFLKLKIEVTGSALEMYNVVVTFRNGKTFSPDTRLVFRKGSGSRVIDLPGGDRVIRKVRFRYGNLPGGGRAQVSLFGR